MNYLPSYHSLAAHLTEGVTGAFSVPRIEFDLSALDCDHGPPAAERRKHDFDPILEVVQHGVNELQVAIRGRVLLHAVHRDEAEGVHHVATMYLYVWTGSLRGKNAFEKLKSKNRLVPQTADAHNFGIPSLVFHEKEVSLVKTKAMS